MKALSIHLTEVRTSTCAFRILDSPPMEQDTVMRRRVSRFPREHTGQGHQAGTYAKR